MPSVAPGLVMKGGMLLVDTAVIGYWLLGEELIFATN
jgi:hypothetical protein